MNAATLFSGLGAPEAAMPHWNWAWHAEIEKFPAAVLAARHPDSINLGDVTADGFTERAAAIARPDILVFGSPCQSFSVAGKRLGLDDPRGNLALVALGIIARLRPRWFVFENVPGLMSSAEGRDFGLFLRTVDDIGCHVAWDVLDAQWFGVAQRRQRVFAVGHIGDWRGPAAVLLEPQSLRGDHPPRRQAGERHATTIASRPTGGGGLGTDFDCDGGLIADTLSVGANQTFGFCGEADGFDASEDGTGRGTPLTIGFQSNAGSHGGDIHDDLAPTLRVQKAGGGGMPAIAMNLLGRDEGARPELSDVASIRAASGGSSRSYVAFAQNQRDEVREMPVAGSLAKEAGMKQQTYVAIPINSDADRENSSALTPSADAEGRVRLRDPGLGIGQDGDPMFTLQSTKPHAVAFDARQSDVIQYGNKTGPLDSDGQTHGILAGPSVRRLTPRECERLQGFPDDYTLIQYRGQISRRWPALQSLGQQHGRSCRALDTEPDRTVRNATITHFC